MGESSLTTFRAAHAAGGAWQPTVRRCLDQLGRVGPGETLGFVYVSDVIANDLPRMVALLRSETGIADWVGTVGMGICATGREYFDEPAAAVMVAGIPRSSFRLVPARSSEAEELPASLVRWIAERQPPLGLVHADPRNPETPEILADLAERSGAYLVGGLSSSRSGMAQVADEVRQKVVSGVLFASDVAVLAGLSQGCVPVGPPRTVTRAERNLLASVDGKPALRALLEDLGAPSGSDLRRTLAAVHVALPIPGSDTGDYLVRNLVGVDPASGVLAVGAEIDPGDKVMFCRRDPETAEQDLRRMLGELRRRLSGPPKGGVYVSCLARGPNMFGAGSRELGIVAEELGEFPLVGFFANGEVCNNRMYGYTGVLTLFQ